MSASSVLRQHTVVVAGDCLPHGVQETEWRQEGSREMDAFKDQS